MDYRTKYQRAFQQLPDRIRERRAKNKLTALGYASNLDLICDYDVAVVNRLMDAHMQQYTPADIKPAKAIRTIEDLLMTLVYYCMNGIGGEVDVADEAVVKQHFTWLSGIGGTGVQAAMALSAVDCPSVVHLTDDSKAVCDILNSASIHTVNAAGELIATDQAEHKTDPELHFIMQFKKGERIRWSGGEVVTAASNRLILTKVTVNDYMPINKPYFTYLEEHADAIASNVVSSFNCVLDHRRLDQILTHVCRHIDAFREASPSAVVFMEDAHYHDKKTRMSCIERLYPMLDIISVNEEELAYTMHTLKREIDLDDVSSCVDAAVFLRGRYQVRRGVIVHTKNYSMYVGDSLRDDINIEEGLLTGNLLATAKAEYGTYGTLEQIGKILSYPLSQEGIRAAEIVSGIETAGQVVLVPTCYIERPKYTIGLGDCFVAGVQVCF